MSGLSFDLTLTAGNILEVFVIGGGGLITLSRFTTKFAIMHASFASVKLDLIDMKAEMKKVNEILALASESERRIGRLEDDFRELRKGRGWIQGTAGIDREYP